MTSRCLVMVLLLTGFLALTQPVLAQKPIPIADLNRDTPVSFEDEILPILQKNCLACHSASEGYGDLVLESPATMIQGGDTGPAIVPGKGAESLLLKAAAHLEEPLMPPPDNDVAAKNLTSQELGLIQLWIDQGARSTGITGLLSPKQWRPLPPGPNPIYALAVTPDGQFAACGRANQIFIYHVPTGQLITRLTDPELQESGEDSRPGIAHRDLIQSLTFNQQGDRLASGGFRTAKIWRYPRDVQRFQFASTETVTAVAVSRDRRWIATGAADHSVRLWNSDTGEAGAVLEGHTDSITALRFSRDGSKVYSSSLDRTIRAWSLPEGTLLGRIVAPEPIRALTSVFQPLPPAAEEAQESAGQPAANSAEGDPPSDDPEASVADPPADPPGLEMLVSGHGNLLQLWDIPQSLPHSLTESLAGAKVMALSADRRYLALAGAKGEVQVRDTDSGTIINTWSAGEMALVAMALAPVAEEMPEDSDDQEQAEPNRVEADADADDSPSDLAAASLQLATAAEDGSIRIWDAGTGELLTTLRGSLQPVHSLAYSPDSTWLAAGNATGEITEWQLSLAPDEPIRSEGPTVEVAVTSPDGKLLATAEAMDGQPAILVRDLASGRTVSTLLGHQAPILALAFNTDGTRLVSGSEDQTTRVWDLADAKFPEIARFDGHAGAVGAVAFNGDASQILSGAADGSLKLWNVADGSEVMDFPGHTAAIHGVALLQGNQPVSASADKSIRYWNVADGKATRTITEEVAITAFAASGDSARLAAAVGPETKIYQATDGAVQATLAGLKAPAHALAFNSDNTRLISVNATDAAVHRLADGRLLQIVTGQGPLTAGTIGGTGQMLYLGEEDGAIRRHTLRFGRSWGDMQQSITSLIYRDDGQVLFTASTDGTIRGFNLQNGQPLFNADHGAPVHDLALSPDQQTLASAGEDKVRLFNAANGAAAQPPELAGLAGPIKSVAFAGEGSKIVAATAAETPQLAVFARADGTAEQFLQGEFAADQVVVFGNGPERVLGLSPDGASTEWRLLARQRFAGHTGLVTSLTSLDSPQPDSSPLQILSGSEDGTLRHWDLAADNPLLRQMNHGAPIMGVAAHGGAERFASVSENHTVRLWNTANGQQLAEMQGDLGAKELVAKLNLEKTDWTAKVAAAKTALEAAQQDVPTKTEAEKEAATLLADARKEADAKQAELTKTMTAKVQAEKAAIEAAAAAQSAALKMRDVNQKALLLAAKVERMSEKMTQAQTISQNNPDNEQLGKIAEETAAELAQLQEDAKAAEAAKEAPTQQAQAAAKVADDAAAKVVEMTKPFTDATTAFEAAQTTLRTTSQAHEIAVRDLEQAKQAVTDAEKRVETSEETLTKVEAQLAEAVTKEQEAQLPLRTVAFSPDGRTLATGGDLGVVHTWGAASGNAISSYRGHAGPIQTLTYLSADQIVSGSADKQAILWEINPDWELERVIGSIDDPSLLVDRVVTVDFSNDGRLLATGGGVPSRSGEVKIWKVEDGSLVHSMPEAHTDAVNAVAFSNDGDFLASVAADKLIKKWDVSTGEMMLQFEGHTGHVLGVDWRANGQVLASCGGDGTVRIWNARTGDRIRTIQGYNKQVTDLRFVGQTQFVVATSGDPIVRMHNTDNGGTQRNFGGAEDYMYAIDATPDSEIVVAGGHDGVLRIWNGNNAQVVHALDAGEGND